jgi:hypothetical protein
MALTVWSQAITHLLWASTDLEGLAALTINSTCPTHSVSFILSHGVQHSEDMIEVNRTSCNKASPLRIRELWESRRVEEGGLGELRIMGEILESSLGLSEGG